MIEPMRVMKHRIRDRSTVAAPSAPARLLALVLPGWLAASAAGASGIQSGANPPFFASSVCEAKVRLLDCGYVAVTASFAGAISETVAVEVAAAGVRLQRFNLSWQVLSFPLAPTQTDGDVDGDLPICPPCPTGDCRWFAPCTPFEDVPHVWVGTLAEPAGFLAAAGDLLVVRFVGDVTGRVICSRGVIVGSSDDARAKEPPARTKPLDPAARRPFSPRGYRLDDQALLPQVKPAGRDR